MKFKSFVVTAVTLSVPAILVAETVVPSATPIASETPTAAIAEETLTMDSIVTLSSIGLGDEAIIAKIKSSKSKFDLSTDQMIMLKKSGVSGPVIAAMLGSAPTAPVMSMDSPDPMVPHPSGVYMLADDHMVRIDATVTNQAKTGGIFGYALTGGIASMSVKAAIQNETARTKTSTKPAFYFFFDDSNLDGSRSSGTWLAGTAATVCRRQANSP